MTQSDSAASPHYFTIENQESDQFGSDEAAVPKVSIRPAPRRTFFPRHDPRRRALKDAIEVLRIVASRDADYARARNGEGFNKADSSAGHMLSEATLETALGDEQLAARILRLAARYKRQVLRLSQLDLL